MNGEAISFENKLFLVCPNGYLEPDIRLTFGDNCYFSTSLGVFFNWDQRAQINILEFIRKRGIRHIFLVDSAGNSIYKEFLETFLVPLNMPLQRHLISIYHNAGSSVKWQSVNKLQLRFFVADHLDNQLLRLRNTSFLGDLLAEQDINVGAFLYDPHKKIFHNVQEVCDWSGLFYGINYN